MPIKLKPAAQMGATLDPGEFAIDGPARRLYIDPGSGPRPIPLDRQPVPPPPAQPDPRMVLLWGPDGPEFDILTAGSGGRGILDEPGWFAPGVALSGLMKDVTVSNPPSDPYYQMIDVAEPILIRRFLVMPKGGQSGSFVFGLADEGGTPILQLNGLAQSGWSTPDLAFALPGGRYRAYIGVAAPLIFQGYAGQAQWVSPKANLLTNDHLLFLRLN